MADLKKILSKIPKTEQAAESLGKYHGIYDLGGGLKAEIKPNPGRPEAGTRISISGPGGGQEITHPSLDSADVYEYLKQNFNLPEADLKKIEVKPGIGSSLAGGAAMASPFTNPAELAEKAYGTYTKGVSDVAKKIADKIYKTTSEGVLTKEQQEEDPARKVLEFGTEMAIDPLNYLGPGEIKALGAVAAGIKGIKKEKAVKDVAEKLIQNAKKATESRKFEPVVSSKWGTVTKDVPLPAKELAESVAPAGSHSGVELATKWEGSREFGKEPLGVSRGQGLAVREGEIESAKDAAARYLQYLQKMKKPKLP